MALTPREIATLSRLLDQALVLPRSEREAWLHGLPAEQQAWVPHLRDMLAKAGPTGAADLISVLPRLDEAFALAGTEAKADDLVGPYRLLREIGQGGMGSVWLATRADGVFVRQVAIKLPRLAWGSGLAERMARERHIGARLEHPNIARLYDAGVDERSRPYLALEYIDGQPLDDWCNSRHLGVRERLRLLEQVTRAVAYAHARLVVHRDIKPSNVLVTADGQPHLLDFGIAKLLSDVAGGDDALTQQQGRVLTPRYASPEQLRGDLVTVASDVYSLGVLSYELLTGRRPHEPRRPGVAALEEQILSEEPPPASTRAGDKIAAGQLRGEFDAVLGKALKRDPKDRYATADAFADDIVRFLKFEPVSARPDSAAYRLRKAARRHRVGLAATAAVLAAVLSGAGIATLNAQRAAKAAERERIVKEFVGDVFRINARAPASAGGLRSATSEAFLEHSARLVQTRFSGQPQLQAELYAVVGGVFVDMGASRLASEYATRRIEALTAARAAPEEHARALIQVAGALLADERLEDAEGQARRAIELAAKEPQLEVDAQVLLARVLIEREKIDAAGELLRTVEASLALPGGSTRIASAWVPALRAAMLAFANQRGAALPLLDAAIEKALAIEGPDSLAAVAMRVQGADMLSASAHDDRFERYLSEAIATLRRLGNEHQVRAAMLRARFTASRCLSCAQISAETALAAVAAARQEVAASGRVVPEDTRNDLDDIEAGVLAAWGNIQAAFPQIEKSALARYPSARSPLERFLIARRYGGALAESGRHELADRWLRETLRLRVERGRGRHPYAAWDHVFVAENLAHLGRHADALAILDTAPAFPPIEGEGSANPHRYRMALLISRSRIELMRGDPQAALKAFPQAYVIPPPWTNIIDRGDTKRGAALLGEVLCALGRTSEGLKYLAMADEAAANFNYYKYDPSTNRRRAVAGLCALKHGEVRLAIEAEQQAREAFLGQTEVSDYFKEPWRKLEAALASRGPARVERREGSAPGFNR